MCACVEEERERIREIARGRGRFIDDSALARSGVIARARERRPVRNRVTRWLAVAGPRGLAGPWYACVCMSVGGVWW